MLKNRVPSLKTGSPNIIQKCTICGMKYKLYGSAKPLEKCEMCDGKTEKSRKTFTSWKRSKVNRNPRIIKRN